MPDKQETLFDRIGGDQAIAELIHQFYDRVVADPELKPFFTHSSMEKIRRMQREFFSAALDGPISYTGKPLGHVHHGRVAEPRCRLFNFRTHVLPERHAGCRESR